MGPVNKTRLNKWRQMSVSNAIAASLAANRPTPLLPSTVSRGEVVVTIGMQLRTFTDLTGKQVNHATAGVLLGLEAVLENKERMISGSLVPRSAAQEQCLTRVHLIKLETFPQGTFYLRWPMDMQWPELVKVRDTLTSPAVAAAVDAEGLTPCVESLLANIALYGQVVGHDVGGSKAGEEDTQTAWNDAMYKFAAQVALDYEESQAIREELLGPYERQVEEQLAANRARRAARLKAAQGDGQVPAPAPAPAPAPTAPAPEPPPESPAAEADVAPRSAA